MTLAMSLIPTIEKKNQNEVYRSGSESSMLSSGKINSPDLLLKRNFSSLNRPILRHRQPLRETNSNIPSPNKRQKLNTHSDQPLKEHQFLNSFQYSKPAPSVKEKPSVDTRIQEEEDHVRIEENLTEKNIQPTSEEGNVLLVHAKVDVNPFQDAKPKTNEENLETIRSAKIIETNKSDSDKENRSESKVTTLDKNRILKDKIKQEEKKRSLNETNTKKKPENQKTYGRFSGDQLHNWQQSWRKIMKESVVYFEGIQEKQLNEYKKVAKLLKVVGCRIVPFFNGEVTIIISKRPFDEKNEYPVHDIFSKVSKSQVKVWTYEKVLRFLKNLGINIQTGEDEQAVNTHTILPASLTNDNNLSNLLKEEKIYGSADRDPNAKRDDLYYFGKNYLYVYDLSQMVRPLAMKEWNDHEYPILHYTLDGKCPFLPDTSDQNTEKRRMKRQKKFETSKNHRQALRQATDKLIYGVTMKNVQFNATSTSTDKIEEIDEEDDAEDDVEIIATAKVTDTFEFRQPLTRNSSCIQSKVNEVMASGYNGASNAQNLSMDSNLNSAAIAAGNGLGPQVSQVPSKNLNNLKRRIFMKRKSSESTAKKEKQVLPGYCENCRTKYDNFNDHISSNRHRNFACDDKNFKDIDDLIYQFKDHKSLGYSISNGDYI